MARLLVLWLLAERQLTGYDIRRALTDEGLKLWFGLEDGSIYSVLRTLTKHGHTAVVGVEQQGNRPARTRYRITASGRRHYHKLLIHSIRTPVLPVAPIDVALAARGDLDPSTVSEALAARTKALGALAADIETYRAAAPAGALVDRNLSIVQAELDWLGQLDQRTVT